MINSTSPLFFEPNRIRKPFLGGRMLGLFFGNLDPVDTYMSEEWLASTTSAEDGENPEDGLSRISAKSEEDSVLFRDFLKIHSDSILGPAHTPSFGCSTMLNIRMIDTAEDLPVRCRVSEGESLNIIGTRDIGGHEARLLIGCKVGVTGEAFSDAAGSGQREDMESVMHDVPIQPGETYYIPPGIPYSIGAGTFVMRVTGTVDDYLTADNNLSAYNGERLDFDDLLSRIKPREIVLARSDAGVLAEAIGPDFTKSFTIQRSELSGQMDITLPREFALVLCAAGEGKITWADGSRDIHVGDFFLQPYGVPWISYKADERLCLIIALPPRP